MLQPKTDAGRTIRTPGGRFWRKPETQEIQAAGAERTMSGSWTEILAERWEGELRFGSPMSEWCTLKVGGPAHVVALPASEAELLALLEVLKEMNVPWLVIGRGSNLLVRGEGYNGVVVVLGKRFGKIRKMKSSVPGYRMVRVEAGCSLMRLVNWCSAEGLSGLEFAVGIPGSVGGAVSMNAGAWGGEMGDVLECVTFVSPEGKVEKRQRQDLTFSYRYLDKDDRIVIGAEFLLAQKDPQEIEARCRELIKKRNERQPLGIPSAGSFFKNPEGGKSAGQLIDETGLKGLRIGGAQVSPVHANFLVNAGKATAKDFLDLMVKVQQEVMDRFGIMLEPEVNIL